MCLGDHQRITTLALWTRTRHAVAASLSNVRVDRGVRKCDNLVCMRSIVALVVLMSSQAFADGETVQASVEAINEADLGRPYNGAFAPITGKDARPLFPAAKAPRKTLVNEWRSDFVEVDNLQTLRANARAWGIADGAIDASTDKRFLVFRVRVVEHVLEVDDTTEPRVIDAASGATFYVRKIYFGRMYEIVLSGSRSDLSASVVSKIKLLPAKFGVGLATSQFKLNVVQKAKGLKPTSDAVFARTVDEIKTAYQNKDMGPPVPILVEYRRIPGVKAEPLEPIDWTATATTSSSSVRSRILSVAAVNSDWTTTGLNIKPDEIVFGIATGKATYAGWGTPPAEPDSKGSGGLDMRIGSTVSAAGKTWFADAGQSGELKLRVRDSKHSDNSGAYAVMVIVMPRDMLTSNCAKLDAQGSESPCN